MEIKKLKIIYEDNLTVIIKNATFKKWVNHLLNTKITPKEPISLIFVSTGKQLYFDRSLFEAYSRDEITQEELILQTAVTGIYRNSKEIIGISGIQIDPGALWKLKDKILILIDDDQYVEAILCPNNFEQIN